MLNLLLKAHNDKKGLNTFSQSLLKNGNLEKAEYYISHFLDYPHIKPDQFTFNILLDVCAKNRQHEEIK